MADDQATEGLSPELMDELLQQLQSDEAGSQASRLDSLDSLQGWINSQPALRQMMIVENFADIGPAILSFLRLMLGYDSAEPEAPAKDAVKPDQPQ